MASLLCFAQHYHASFAFYPLSNDPWFRGPWFVRVKEVQHLPTRMFFPGELFLSNIQDTNPMRSIIRKCAVLPASDYCKCESCDWECVSRDLWQWESYVII